MTYQLYLLSKGQAPFALPVLGTKRSIWNALAVHLRFESFASMVVVQGIKDVERYKAKFELRKVEQ